MYKNYTINFETLEISSILDIEEIIVRDENGEEIDWLNITDKNLLKTEIKSSIMK